MYLIVELRGNSCQHVLEAIQEELGLKGKRENLRFSYDADQDILYLHFKDGPSENVKEIEHRVIVELDKSGAWDWSSGMPKEEVS